MKRNKIFILIILFVLCIIPIKSVQAKSSTFYAAEWLNDIYYTKSSGGKTITTQARVIRNTATNQIAYCLEPFVFLEDNVAYPNQYNSYTKNLKLTKDQYERIMLLSYYGYQYKNHKEQKWHTITQILIWRTIDSKGSYYWVNSKGEKINVYQSEIKELENLVKNHKTKPSFLNDKPIFSVNGTYSIQDTNQVLENYTIKESNIAAKINKNNIEIHTGEEQSGKIILERKDKTHVTPMIIHYSSESQNLVEIGSYTPIVAEFDFKVESGSIKIKKIDSTTKESYPQGEASLIGTKFHLLDDKKYFLQEIIIGEDGTATISNLKFGTYYLQEVDSGEGYKIDDTIHEIVLSEEQETIELVLENEVIKSKIVLKKYYGNKYNLKAESNVEFKIYDKDKRYIASIITDNNGEAEIQLPYGTYTFKQVNSKNNYQKVDDFTIVISKEEEIVKKLYDLEIETPNTAITDNKLNYLFLSITAFVVCWKIKI